MTVSIQEQNEDTIEISLSEYESIKALATAISERDNRNQTNQQALESHLVTVIETLHELLGQSREPLVIPPAEITVKASDVIMPAMPAPVVTVMEAPEGRKTYTIRFKRDAKGLMQSPIIVEEE